MELRHLRYFVAVAKKQNITQAAEILHISQSTISRQIKDLEGEIGFSLFEHGAKSVRLTEAGRLFLPAALAILQQLDIALQQAKAVASGIAGEIHVGYAPSLTSDILPTVLRKLWLAHPNFNVRLFDMSTQEMVEGLRSGALHVALLVQISDEIESEFSFQPLRNFGVCLAVGTRHRFSRVRRISLRQIASENLISYSSKDYPEYHRWLRRLFAPVKLHPKIVEEHESVSSLVASIEAGRGVAMVLKSFERFESPRLKVRPVHPPPPPVVLGVAHRKSEYSSFVTTFVNESKDAISRSQRMTREQREPLC